MIGTAQVYVRLIDRRIQDGPLREHCLGRFTIYFVVVMDDRTKMDVRRLILVIVLGTFTGCAQTQYHAGNLPQKYVAKSIRDYSQLDLTAYATQAADPDSIKSGDRLQVTLDPGTLEAESSLTWNVSVDETGQTSLPNIGSIRLAGLNSAQAEKAIVQTSLQRDVFLTPVVEVKVEPRRQRQIFVSGAVKQPGMLKIDEDTISLASVIARSGGVTSSASGTITVSGATESDVNNPSPLIPNAILPVGQTTVKPVTVSLETTPDRELGRIMVPEGAVVNVEATLPRPIKVVGVINDQVVEVPAGQNVRLLDAITAAGGQTYSNWISDRLTITRYLPEENRTIRIRGSIRKARQDSKQNILLAPYDVVTVEENAFTFTLSTLSGLFNAGATAARIGI